MATTSPNPAETYEQFMVPPLFGPCATHLIRRANPRPGDKVLDVACGTGIVARRAASHVGSNGKVIGLDLNPDMLAVARTTSSDEGLDIEWRKGRAEELPFQDGDFNVVLCQFGLMFFADQQAALNEMHRVLDGGGRVAIGVWQGLDCHPFYRTLDDVIQRRFGMSGVRDIFALGDVDALRALVTSAGFHDVEIEPVSLTARFPAPDAFLAGEIDVDTAAIPAMQNLDADARREITEALHDDMTEALREVTEGDHVVMPFHALMALAYR